MDNLCEMPLTNWAEGGYTGGRISDLLDLTKWCWSCNWLSGAQKTNSTRLCLCSCFSTLRQTRGTDIKSVLDNPCWHPTPKAWSQPRHSLIHVQSILFIQAPQLYPKRVLPYLRQNRSTPGFLWVSDTSPMGNSMPEIVFSSIRGDDTQWLGPAKESHIVEEELSLPGIHKSCSR